MWMTFKTTVRTLLHTPSAIVWTLIFPIVLATVFNFMFEPLRSGAAVEAVDVAVVDDEAWRESPFADVVTALANADEPLLAVHSVDSADEARELLVNGAATGAYLVEPAPAADEGTSSATQPRVILAAQNSNSDAAFDVNRSIVEAVATSYLQNQALIERIASEGPAALANPSAVERALGLSTPVREISLTHARPDLFVRFYYALLAMASIFSAQLAVGSVWDLQPVSSAAGARRAVSGTGRMRLLVPTIAACWTVSAAFLAIALGYICLTAGIDFAGREALCLVGISMASLFSCSLGAVMGALPGRMGLDARTGLLTASTCLLSFFAGLYGQPSMEFADTLAQAFPVTTWLNPVCLIRDVFYSVYYYDALGPFLLRITACGGLSVAFLGISTAFMRRLSHEHL